MKFASKQALVDDIETAHDALVDLLASIPAVRRREPGVWGDGWTVNDLIAHLAEWHVMFLRWYREGLAGDTPSMPAPGYTWKQTPDLNRAIWRKHRRESAPAVVRAFDRSYREIHAVSSSLPSATLLEPGRFSWTGPNPLATYLGANTGSHYRFAIKVLRRWLRQGTAPERRRSRHRTRA